MAASYMRGPSNKITLESTEAETMPIPMILGNKPFSFVIHARYASTGEKRANNVQPPIMTVL